jgi:hypothetical protein
VLVDEEPDPSPNRQLYVCPTTGLVTEKLIGVPAQTLPDGLTVKAGAVGLILTVILNVKES